MNNDPRGNIFSQRDFMRIDNALIEEVVTSDNRTGHILVSYAVREPNFVTTVQTLQLNVGPDTIILGPFGMRICLCRLRRGMWINAVFSRAMTASIPPQSSAILIMVPQQHLNF